VSGYAVDFPDLQTASMSMTATADGLAASLAGLSADVDALLTSGWRGRAASGFAADWGRWHAAARDVLGVLHLLAADVGRGGAAYVATETEVRRAVAL
jgi:WXG100 family type VII secretion target